MFGQGRVRDDNLGPAVVEQRRHERTAYLAQRHQCAGGARGHAETRGVALRARLGHFEPEHVADLRALLVEPDRDRPCMFDELDRRDCAALGLCEERDRLEEDRRAVRVAWRQAHRGQRRRRLARCIRTADEVAQEAQLTKLWVLDVVRARLERVAKESEPEVSRVRIELEHVRHCVEHHRRRAGGSVDVGHLARDGAHRDLEDEDLVGEGAVPFYQGNHVKARPVVHLSPVLGAGAKSGQVLTVVAYVAPRARAAVVGPRGRVAHVREDVIDRLLRHAHVAEVEVPNHDFLLPSCVEAKLRAVRIGRVRPMLLARAHVVFERLGI
mmetsp:Transcript_39120/g.85983  ORF Transcript_39120/g.85983 Transcript_39120/m.85983 type:complete len:326 (-) Transcript_39120:738-1715(-)